MSGNKKPKTPLRIEVRELCPLLQLPFGILEDGELTAAFKKGNQADAWAMQRRKVIADTKKKETK